MADRLSPEVAALLTALVEKVGLLRRELQRRGDLGTYEARIARIDQKCVALADHLSDSQPEVAQAVRTAWELPARSLAVRNVRHREGSDDKS